MMKLTRSALLVVGALALTGCAQKLASRFEPTALPEEVVPFFDEAAAFEVRTATEGTGRLVVDLGFLIGEREVERALLVPFDAESWYEPIPVELAQGRAAVEVPLDRDLLAILDLGEAARNGYQAFGHVAAGKGLIPREMRPRLCDQILCAAEPFRLDTLGERLPELEELPVEAGRFLPPIEVGPVPGGGGDICSECFERPPSILPCLAFKWCGEFPLRRKLHVRRNIYSLSPGEIDTLRSGVATMKGRPATDPTSWAYQAKMHAIDSGTALALQDQCQHRQFLFFSWHRMFTYYFERILRAATGDPDFALPYWNYTDLDAQRVIPEAYRLPADPSNALYNATRSGVYNGGVALPAADVSYSSGFDQVDFASTSAGVASFGGRAVTQAMHFPSPSPGSGEIERSPHNNVHNDIGGDMAGGESPLDPVFWLHHANIDRLWNRWIALGNGRANPTGDTFWMTHVFDFFDENGNQVSLTGAEVLHTASQLGYRYDDDIYLLWPFEDLPILVKRWPDFPPPVELASVVRQVRLGTERLDLEMSLSEEGTAELAEALEAEPAQQRILLQIRGIRYDEPVGVTYLLFLNLPEGPEGTEKPDHTHPSFVGTLGFFGTAEGTGHAEEEEGVAEQYDVTRVVRRLGMPERLVVSILPSLPEAPAERKDLQELVARMAPKGNPRFGSIALLKLEAKE
jgi:tyrosinase